MKHMICKDAICPFYLHEDSQVIYCTGLQDGVVLHIAFRNKTVAKDYKLKHCRHKDYMQCKIAQMLADKTDDLCPFNRPP